MTEPLTETQAVEILRNRAATYGFLSHVFRTEVSEALLAQLAEQLRSDGEEEMDSQGYRTLREYVAGMDQADVKERRTELASEYAALFLNMGRRPVSPFESVYTSPERLLMQKARDQVLSEYRREGLDRVDGFHEPEDHVAIELEFMAYLCQKAAGALEAGEQTAAAESLQKQRAFLEDHLLIWVPEFCSDVHQSARTGFYKGIAQITGEHLSMDRDTVDELLAAVA